MKIFSCEISDIFSSCSAFGVSFPLLMLMLLMMAWVRSLLLMSIDFWLSILIIGSLCSFS